MQAIDKCPLRCSDCGKVLGSEIPFSWYEEKWWCAGCHSKKWRLGQIYAPYKFCKNCGRAFNRDAEFQGTSCMDCSKGDTTPSCVHITQDIPGFWNRVNGSLPPADQKLVEAIDSSTLKEIRDLLIAIKSQLNEVSKNEK